MQPDLEALTITQRELDTLTGLEISDTSMGWANRPSVFRHPKHLLSFITTQVLTFAVLLIFCLPISLVIVHNFSQSDDANYALRFLPITLGMTVAIALLWNGYLWFQGRRLKTLGHLLDEVDRYQETVMAAHILDELGEIKHSKINLDNREEVLNALSLTRESLVCALITEKILRKHQRFIARRQEMFISIEHNLSALQALQLNNTANEYGHLLNQALQIGASVHQEMRQLGSIESPIR